MDDFSVAVPYQHHPEHVYNRGRNHQDQDQKQAAMLNSCPFLTLPQELRDLIFEYTILDCSSSDLPIDVLHPNPTERRLKQVPISTDNRWEWIVSYAERAPTLQAAYFNLMRCNRQLRNEIREFVKRVAGQNQNQSDESSEAKITLLLAYPESTPLWTSITLPPFHIRTLELLVKVDHMYHPAYMTRGSQNAILAAVFDILKRHIHRGPHLARSMPLCQPLHLDTVRITLAPPVPFEELTHVYGFPAQQLETLYNQFHAMVARLARSGILYGSIDTFEVRLQGLEWDRMPVTSNIWDEEDFIFFQYGGYSWDGGDAPSFEVDLMPWL